MMLSETALICLLAMASIVGDYGGHLPPQYDARLQTCLDVAIAAEDADLPVALVVSVAYEESSFIASTISKAGAHGPLQIIPRYHCPTPEGEHLPHKRRGTLKGCDLVVDGVAALKWFWVTYDNDWPRALAHYSSGEKIYSSSRAYAKRVQRRARLIDTQLDALLEIEARDR